MKDFKDKIKEQGRQYFKKQTPDIDVKHHLEFKQPEPTIIKQRLKWRPFAFASGSLVATLAASVAIGAVILSSNRPLYEQGDHGLASVRDVNELRDLITSNEQNRDTGGLDYNDVPETVTSETTATDDESTSYGEHSETNVQVEGVDEGDIVKTDGDRIYKINYNRLQVIDVLDDGQMDLVLDQSMDSENESNSYTYFSDLYLSDDYLVAIGQRYTFFSYGVLENQELDYIAYDYWYGFPQTTILLYDLDDLSIVHEMEINGSIISSRRIDDRLYVISNHYPIMAEDDDDPRPVFRLDEQVMVPEFGDIKYLSEFPTETFTIVTTIFLDEEVTLDFDVFLGASGWGIVYVSHNAIYLASYIYFYNQLTLEYTSKGIIMSYMFEEDGTVSFGGAGAYEGYVINQFAIDEYDGYLRMVTTEGWSDTVVNRLYVFARTEIEGQRSLSQVGLLDEGIGKPRETVRSVRFNGTTATIVTYEQTDPLYVVDLSDPTSPTIRAGLEVTGYATYQHVWEPHLIIGIGYESEGWQIFGLKLTLFDITDPDNPIVVGSPLVLDFEDYGWSYSEALYNHKALLISKPFGFIGFSISTYHYMDEQYWYSSDYFIFDIDPESDTPVSIATTISHSQFIVEYTIEDPETDYYYWYREYVNIDRAVTIGNYLFVLSNLAITSHDINDSFALTSFVDLIVQAEPETILD